MIKTIFQMKSPASAKLVCPRSSTSRSSRNLYSPSDVSVYLSHVWLFATPWTAARQASLSFTVSRSLLKPRSIESMMPSNHLILCHPFSSCPHFSQPQGLFQWDDSLHQMAKVLSFSFSISPSNEYSGLISFRMNWLDLHAVQGLLRVFFNTAIEKHQFFGTQLSLYSNSHIHTWLLEKP